MCGCVTCDLATSLSHFSVLRMIEKLAHGKLVAATNSSTLGMMQAVIEDCLVYPDDPVQVRSESHASNVFISHRTAQREPSVRLHRCTWLTASHADVCASTDNLANDL